MSLETDSRETDSRYYDARILAALQSGPMTLSDVIAAAQILNVSTARVLFRQDFFRLVNAGRIRRAGTTANGCHYLFEAVA